MEVLNLSPEGLFPLVDSARGIRAATGLPVSGTLQGEGLLIGVPSLFLRLAGCNMRCKWLLPGGTPIACDTPSALTIERGRYTSIHRLIDKIQQHRGSINHLVITGGEPLMQIQGLTAFLETLRANTSNNPLHITIESNGSIFDEGVASLVDLVSLSPKLHPIFQTEVRIEPPTYRQAIQNWLDAKQERESLQLKFVVACEQDGERIQSEYLNHLSLWDTHPIFVMPAGQDERQLATTTPLAVEIAVRHGWRFTQRLHISLWGSRPGC